jgi:hypothetical protein
MLLFVQDLIARYSGRPRAAWVATLLFAFNPSLLAYETFPLYSQATAFLVTLHCWSVARLAERRTPLWLASCLGSLLALIMTRASYLPWLVFPGIAYGSILAGTRARRAAPWFAAFVVVIPFGWCLKNQVQHGFFGLSCWSGMNFFHRAEAFTAPGRLQQLADAGVLDPMVVQVPVFSPAHAYRPFGFTRTSVIPVLAADDLNNVNYPAVCRVYGRNAVRLIRCDPWRFWLTTCEAALLYTAPSSGYRRIPDDMPLYGWLADVWPDWVLGTRLWSLESNFYFCPYLAVEFVGVVVCAGLVLGQLALGRWSRAAFRRHAALYVTGGFMLYNAGISIFAEYGENNRFRYDVEAISYALAIVALLAAYGALVRGVMAFWRSRRGRSGVGSARALP